MELGQTVTAIGGLGTAAFGLVDASKAVLPINNIGFGRIGDAVSKLLPSPAGAMSAGHILDTIKANWVNGTDLASQKSIAKSMIKLNLSAGNAAALAAQTGVDSTLLTSAATKMAGGTPLSSVESDAFGRFDLAVTALLDEAYQHGDQVYRNWTRALAMVVAVVLAVLGQWTAHVARGWGEAILIGLLATPLAPIAKDLSSALATAVNALQAAK
jgi:hypothetical protein